MSDPDGVGAGDEDVRRGDGKASRRLVLAVLGLVMVATPVGGQPAGRVPKIGVLLTAPPSRNLPDLRQGLRDLGYVEGQTIVLEIVSADGKLDRLPDLAREIVRRQVDVIVTSGPPAIAAARAATATIPIVMGRMDDVDVHGFVGSLARPNGNITGLSFQTGELAGKWIGLLKEALPRLSRLGIVWDATGTARQRETAEEAARALGLVSLVLEVRGALALDKLFDAAKAARVEALAILASPALTAEEARLARLSTLNRLPTIYYDRGFPEAGGLMSYGPAASDFSWRRAAAFVDKILKGARPGDLPIEQPTVFELVVNLKTAKALGVVVPPSLRLRADHLIE